MKKFYLSSMVMAIVITTILIPMQVHAANTYNSGTVTIDTGWTVTLGNEITGLTGFTAVTDITTLNITAGTITEADIMWITDNLSNLATLNISGTTNFLYNEIPSGSFSNSFGVLRNLVSVVINPTNEELNFGDHCFGSIETLESVTIPKAKTFDGFAFISCTHLQTVALSEVTSFGPASFYECTSLITINLPMATTFGNTAFANCTNLQTISLPMATTFGNTVFWWNTSLTSVNLPVAVTFGDNVFRNCENLQTISLPMTTSFGQGSFGSCGKLRELHIPKLEAAGSAMLEGHEIGHVLFLDDTPPTGIDLSTFNSVTSPSYVVLQFPVGALSAYDSDSDRLWYGCQIPPLIVSTAPLDNATNVSAGKQLTITFTDAVSCNTTGSTSSRTILIKKVADDSIIEEISFDSAAVTIADKVVTINLSNSLQTGDYYVQIGTEALVNNHNYSFIGINDKTIWNFSIVSMTGSSSGSTATAIATPAPTTTLTPTPKPSKDKDSKPGTTPSVTPTPSDTSKPSETPAPSETPTPDISDVSGTSGTNNQLGTITGTLVDGKGKPLAGYYVTLYSDPITVVTDEAGMFLFTNVPLTKHILVVADANEVEIDRHELSFESADSESADIDESANKAALTYTSKTTTVYLTLTLNDKDITISDVTFLDEQGNENLTTEKEEKNAVVLWIAFVGIILLCGTGAFIVYKKVLKK